MCSLFCHQSGVKLNIKLIKLNLEFTIMTKFTAICSILFVATVVIQCNESIDESCLFECDTPFKIQLRQKFCEDCERMPLRFGRHDPGYNNKLAIIFKSMWKNPKLQHIPKELIDIIRLKHRPDSGIASLDEDSQNKVNIGMAEGGIPETL